MRTILISLMAVLGLAGCGGEPSTSEDVEGETAGSEDVTVETTHDGSEAEVTATQPDAALFTSHLREHAEYPASRETIIAACVDTPEFTDGEKQWIEQNLPEGEYQTADEVIEAMGL